mmetsp:Transcript_37997/g.88928  ORF Transcript_37997/g.88928 Transcript_37997/m.88928 type:complete len:342 (+) Transcript_37997:696-1721(+)
MTVLMRVVLEKELGYADPPKLSLVAQRQFCRLRDGRGLGSMIYVACSPLKCPLSQCLGYSFLRSCSRAARSRSCGVRGVQLGHDLVGQPGSPRFAHTGALKLALLEEAVAQLGDVLECVGPHHDSLAAVGGAGGAAVQHSVVVDDDERVLGPLERHHEARVLDEAHPLGVRSHHRLEGLVRQRAHPPLDLGVCDALDGARRVELDHWMGVAVLKDSIVPRAEVAVVAVGIVMDRAQRVCERHGREQPEGLGIGAAQLLGRREAVTHTRHHRALRLVHELQEAWYVVDEGVVGVHRERVAEVIVRQVVGRRRRRHLLSHDAPGSAPPWVSVQLADEPIGEAA